jgi:chromosome segregation ATPase
MDTIVYGWIIAMLAFALVLALAYLGAILKQNADMKDRKKQYDKDMLTCAEALSRRQQTINGYAKRCLDNNRRIDKLTEDLRVAQEEINYVYETVRDQEELIKQKDEEIGYNEQYMASQQHVLELSQKEIDDLHRKLKAAESPGHLKACLLEKIQEVANLQYLNTLLESANQTYANDLKLIKKEFQDMMLRINAAEFDQIRFPKPDPYPEMYDMDKAPDLGHEACSPQESHDPAHDNSTQASACF